MRKRRKKKLGLRLPGEMVQALRSKGGAQTTKRGRKGYSRKQKHKTDSEESVFKYKDYCIISSSPQMRGGLRGGADIISAPPLYFPSSSKEGMHKIYFLVVFGVDLFPALLYTDFVLDKEDKC
ncbi:MAG: hypothetical protein HY764_00705 [Candidatus Portnoybacteria bacterium]|nr:hypothetical protein [Candidatus Portnoybacteria bacterium]